VKILLKAIVPHSSEIKSPVMNSLPITMASWVRGRSRSPHSKQHILSERIRLMSPRAVAAILIRCVIHEKYLKRVTASWSTEEDVEFAAFFGVKFKLTNTSVPF